MNYQRFWFRSFTGTKKFFIVVVLLIFMIITIDFRFVSISCGLKPFQNGECFEDNRSHDYHYIHNEAELCKGDVLLLIMIPSTPDEFLTRQAIRDSWGSVVTRNSDVRLAFILGNPVIDHLGVNRLIHEESNKYHDVIQKDFVDSYRNLSIKSESILHFTSTYCQSAKFILKSDSDVFINVKSLVKYLQQTLQETNYSPMSITGHKCWRISIPDKSETNKFGLQVSDYPLSLYPDYIAGLAYVIPGKLTKSFMDMSLKTRMFRIEDVYVTGILRERIGLPVKHHSGFQRSRCSLESCDICNIIVCHGHTVDEHIKLWRLIKFCMQAV